MNWESTPLSFRGTGYHGTNSTAAEKIAKGGFVASTSGWIGPGVYFYDNDPEHAHFFAKKAVDDRGGELVLLRFDLDFEQILDLTARQHRDHFKRFVRSFLSNAAARERFCKSAQAQKKPDVFFLRLLQEKFGVGKVVRFLATDSVGAREVKRVREQVGTAKVDRSLIVDNISILICVSASAVDQIPEGTEVAQ